MNRFKNVVINFIKIILVFLPIIVFVIDFCMSFKGTIYILNIDQTNITAISEALIKDNIKVDDLNNANRIEVCGAGLNDFSYLYLYNVNNGESTCLLSEFLFQNEHYYIKDYLEENCFVRDIIYNISIFISLSIIFSYIYTNKKKK